ncbi:outer membrane protein transport protein [bacterium]|nr:outer membrane protein transport protein [bacterium]
MKKTIKLAIVAALAMGATSAFATNGSNLIGTGAKARGMGGIGIGMSHGAESGLSNPALITTVENTEILFGGTIFMPNVKNENGVDFSGLNPALPDESSSSESAAKLSVIPEVSVATKVNDNFYFGIGMYGTAGMGVDYRDAAATGQMNMVTNLQLMQFGVPLVYTSNNFSIGVTPILQYGSLDINYVMSPTMQNAMTYMSTGTFGTATNPMTIGAGVAQDLKFGYNLGLAYEISGVTIGAVYKSQIDMEYKGQLSTSAGAMTGGAYTNDKLSTPAEMGLGVSYAFNGNTIALDYKQIKWSAAKGYEDFAWEDQTVMAIGYEYSAKTWGARIGYNYASSPISEQTNAAGANGLSGGMINTFNLLGFPAIVESHFSIGGTYALSNQTTVDLAYAYAPEVNNTYKNFLSQDITTKHSQTSVSAQLNYKF